MIHRAINMVVLVICTTVLSLGCYNSATGKNADMEKRPVREIVYRFGDASVPPKYHRSYVITVIPEKVRIVVDSYGDILADRVYDITAGEFKAIVQSLRRHRVEKIPPREDKGCTGGTSEAISYSDEGREIFSGMVYHCGGEDFGDLGGDVKAFADDVKKLIPDLDALLK